ncbi:uncharacterized protein [Aegilops tauschii subsp. strangulata]|uniref:uncharacterized protein n=1 Tax=Aegilops tauschii subsp. strangulata TaxID=200361 RepID=UPI003CC8C828
MRKPFRYECMWEREPSFKTHIEQIWTEQQPATTAAMLSAKLSTIATQLKTWGRRTFGSVRQELRELRLKLAALRAAPDRVGPSLEEKVVQDRMVELSYREEIMMRQRSRIKWLSEGDSNTQYFQKKVCARRARNRIVQLQRQDGSMSLDPEEMAGMATDFYKNLYTSEGTIGMEEVLSHIPVRVNGDMNTKLNAPYTNEEIKEALFQMFPTKAPGPDGFPAHFFQRHWELCEDEITGMIKRVLSGEDSPEDINSTFIVLIPKIASPKILGQFRPISLCNVIYKIASKVLANRLKVILPKVISEEQSAFVPGRLITDNFITAYECLHYMKSRRIKYNRFCALKLDMMKAYDRLEWPYLKAVMLKLGISPVFTAAVMSKGVSEATRLEVKNVLDVHNEALSDKYLGLPSDVGRAKEGCFKYLKDRIWKHVQGWMEKCLSAGGKEVLIKSVAQAIPTYSMACFKLSRGLCEHINSLLRKFWWGSKQGQRKPTWVSWETMCKPKFMGGMGFRDIELFNLALLARQVWRILQEPNSLSARVLKARYFPDGSILEATLGAHPSQVWRSLIEGRDVLALGLIKRIGSGENTSIWHENWLPRDYKLKPMCSISPDPPQTVLELIDPTSRTWNRPALMQHFVKPDVDVIMSIPLSFRVQQDFWAWHYDKRGVFSVRSAYKMISGIKHQREEWLEHRASNSNKEAEKKAWSQIWKVKIPSKVRVFVWRLAQMSLPTGTVRHSRKMATSPSCSICNEEVDSWRHSLFDCRMARCVWALSDEDVLEHMLSNRTDDARLWIFWLFETTNQHDLAKILVMMWAIWWARRKAIHDNEYQSPLSTFSFVNRYLDELEVANLGRTTTTSPAVQQRPARWRPPEDEACVKINVDGAISRRGTTGAAAAVCRGRLGNYLGASAIVLDGLVDTPSLEAHACNEALVLARDLNISHAIVASDCMQVVTDIKRESSIATSSLVDLGSQDTSAAVRTALQANLASGHRKKTWFASSTTLQTAQVPVDDPCLFATFSEVGNLFLNSCHKNTLIFSGRRAFHRPFTTGWAGPWQSLWYRDLTENLPDTVSAQVTESAAVDSEINLLRNHVYAVLQFGQFRTTTKENDLNPVWNEHFYFRVSDPTYPPKLSLKATVRCAE